MKHDKHKENHWLIYFTVILLALIIAGVFMYVLGKSYCGCN